MENLGLVSITGKIGREKQYGAVPSFIVTFQKIVKNFIEKEVNPLVNLLSANVDLIKEENTKKRFNSMVIEYKKAGDTIKMLSKFMSINGGN
jgi:large-conductance mechanosensitive channel